jgi:2-(1,2-epoxy-1,2-dihydrophenyl)acetyl-CoA isomerase
VELRLGAAWITLDGPEAGNALTTATIESLWRSVQAARRADVGVVVLQARGKAFCVGGDLQAFASAQRPDDYVEDLADGLHRVISALHRLDAVVVAVIQGTAAGAGVPLAAAADLVLAAESARFTLAYTKVGLSPDGGSSLLTASLGLHRALHLALLNPVLSAQEAQAAGLVAQVHPDAELPQAVDAVVQQLTAGSRRAQVAAKRLLREQAVPAPETAMRREAAAISAAVAAPDGLEGIAAFLEKRPPRFGV